MPASFSLLRMVVGVLLVSSVVPILGLYASPGSGYWMDSRLRVPSLAVDGTLLVAGSDIITVVQSMQQQIDNQAQLIQQLQADVNTRAPLAALTNAVDMLTDRISLVDAPQLGRLSVQEQLVDQLLNDTVALFASVSLLSSNETALANQLTLFDIALTGNISTLTFNLSSLSTRLHSAETLSGLPTVLSDTVSSHGNSLNALHLSNTSLSGRLSSVEIRVNNAETQTGTATTLNKLVQSFRDNSNTLITSATVTALSVLKNPVHSIPLNSAPCTAPSGSFTSTFGGKIIITFWSLNTTSLHSLAQAPAVMSAWNPISHAAHPHPLCGSLTTVIMWMLIVSVDSVTILCISVCGMRACVGRVVTRTPTVCAGLSCT
jgi:hypothetical protein